MIEGLFSPAARENITIVKSSRRGKLSAYFSYQSLNVLNLAPLMRPAAMFCIFKSFAPSRRCVGVTFDRPRLAEFGLFGMHNRHLAGANCVKMNLNIDP